MVGRQAPKPNIRAGRGWGLDIRLEGCIYRLGRSNRARDLELDLLGAYGNLGAIGILSCWPLVR